MGITHYLYFDSLLPVFLPIQGLFLSYWRRDFKWELSRIGQTPRLKKLTIFHHFIFIIILLNLASPHAKILRMQREHNV